MCEVTTATIATTPKNTTSTTFGPSVDSLCHPWFAATNLSYRFPVFETSANALCGTTGNYWGFLLQNVWNQWPARLDPWIFPKTTSGLFKKHIKKLFPIETLLIFPILPWMSPASASGFAAKFETCLGIARPSQPQAAHFGPWKGRWSSSQKWVSVSPWLGKPPNGEVICYRSSNLIYDFSFDAEMKSSSSFLMAFTWLYVLRGTLGGPPFAGFDSSNEELGSQNRRTWNRK